MTAEFRVVFYDKKNQKEVYHDQLMPINYVESYIVVQDEGRNQVADISELYIKEVQLGSLGYKDDDSEYSNWNKRLVESDLVFLRLEPVESEVCGCNKTTCPDCREE